MPYDEALPPFVIGEYEMSKRSWGRAANGPDWVDLEAAMRAVGNLSGGTVMVTCSPLGIGATGGLRCAVSWTSNTESVGGDQVMAITESTWPCPEGCTLEGHLLAGIYQLDHALVKRMKQSELPT